MLTFLEIRKMVEIKKTHPKFDQLRMVCLSVSKEDTRYTLAGVMVNEKHIVGTDGRRMACLDNFGIDAGYYCVCKVTKSLILMAPKELEGNYPKYDDVMPKESPRKDDLNVIPDCGPGVSVWHYRIAKAGRCVNIKYLADYAAADDWYVSDVDRPLQIYAQGFVALIMPITE
jgi:hypothetical protein